MQRKLNLLWMMLALFACGTVAAPISAYAQTANPTPGTQQDDDKDKKAPIIPKQIPITGAGSGSTFSGDFQIQQFIIAGEKLLAEGVLKGALTDASGKKQNVNEKIRIPVAVTPASAPAPATGPGIAQAARPSCPILDLVLGPLHLNLLGLEIDLNQVVLDITAVPGPGNLLGNLLCAITGLFDPGRLTLVQLADFLNALLGLG